MNSQMLEINHIFLFYGKRKCIELNNKANATCLLCETCFSKHCTCINSFKLSERMLSFDRSENRDIVRYKNLPWV